jgi:hypothetical protein
MFITTQYYITFVGAYSEIHCGMRPSSLYTELKPSSHCEIQLAESRDVCTQLVNSDPDL